LRPFGLNQIYLYDQSVDMRKSFEGLGHLIECAYPGKLLTGSLFLFLNRSRNLIKILYWDGDGFAIWYKRLEAGCFHPGPRQGVISQVELSLILEGIEIKEARRFKRFQLRESIA